MGGPARLGRWSPSAALQGEAEKTTAGCGGQEPFVLSVCGKVAPSSAAAVGQEGERKRSTDDVSKACTDDIKTGRSPEPGMTASAPRTNPISRLNNPARTYRSQRFADALADTNAQLTAVVIATPST